MGIEELRKQYRLGGLRKSDMLADPVQQFQNWFQELLKNVPVDWFEPNAMTLSTVNDQRVTSRIVLLKGVSSKGFTFYTNYESTKGQQLSANPNASLVFYWPFLERQIRVEGSVTKTSREDSKQYFHSRPRGSQLGAVASRQSDPIVSREQLERQLADCEAKYKDAEVPLPDDWGGYLLTPSRFEFWQGRENRLHDRFEYTLADTEWSLHRLSP